MFDEQQVDLIQLEVKHPLVNTYKSLLKLKRTNKSKAKLTHREMEIKLVPYFSMQSSLFFLSGNSLMSLSHSEYDHPKILGEIPASFISSSHKMGQVYLSVQMELVQTSQIPLGYVKELYENFNVEIQTRTKALNIINAIGQSVWQLEEKVNPKFLEKSWIDRFIGNEEKPAQMHRISVVDNKPQFEFFFNYNYMLLIGVLPNILIDVLLQTEQLPEIDTSSDLERWLGLAEGVINSQENPVVIQYQTLIITYEGMKLGCLITETNFHSYSEEKNCHQYVRKITYELTNPNVSQYVFASERIQQNSLEYLMENGTQEQNCQRNHQFLVDTDSPIQIKTNGAMWVQLKNQYLNSSQINQ